MPTDNTEYKKKPKRVIKKRTRTKKDAGILNI